MKYVKPAFNVTKFDLNETVAACDRVVTGTETTKVYEQQSIDCIIGNQQETVFNAASGCSTAANQWGVTEYEGTMYFVWYTYAGDTGSGGAPSQSATNKLNTIVSAAGFTAGPGWHYGEVTSTDMVTDILGFSY